MLSALRHPRKRGVSIGPQSEADAREYIATREQRRRDSRSSVDGTVATPLRRLDEGAASSYFEQNLPPAIADEDDFDSPGGRKPTPRLCGEARRTMLSPGNFPTQPLTPPASDNGQASDYNDSNEREMEEESRMDSAMFLALEKPRVRYDVEVVTKLVVYAGIAWLAAEGNPLLFEFAGLGMMGQR